jgi:hypothetical protein
LWQREVRGSPDCVDDDKALDDGSGCGVEAVLRRAVEAETCIGGNRRGSNPTTGRNFGRK